MTNIVRIKFKDDSVLKITKNIYDCKQSHSEIDTTSPDYKFIGMQPHRSVFSFVIKNNTVEETKKIHDVLSAQMSIQLDHTFSFAESKFNMFVSITEGVYMLLGCFIQENNYYETPNTRLEISIEYDYLEKVTP